VITGLKTIAKFMAVSPPALSRWRGCFRGRNDPPLCFPLMIFPTRKGLAFTHKTHSSIIAGLVARLHIIDPGREGKRTIGGRGGGGRLAREEAGPVHEESHPQTSTPGCPCGIPSRCEVHLQEEPTSSLQDELDKLGPVERAWVINHELSPAQLEELGIKLPET